METIALDTGTVPGALLQRPELSIHLVPIWTAFGMLSTCRTQGMSPGGIPYSEISAYYRDFGDESGYSLREFALRLYAIDNEFLSIIEERSKKRNGRN